MRMVPVTDVAVQLARAGEAGYARVPAIASTGVSPAMVHCYPPMHRQ